MMPYGEPLVIVKCEVSPALRRLQGLLEDLVHAIRSTEKAQKDLLEATKDLEMFRLKDDRSEGANPAQNAERKNQRRQWLRTVYVPGLRAIGVTRGELRRRLPLGLRMTERTIETERGEKLFDLHEGEDAFEAVATGEVLHRVVFRKKQGILQRGDKYYIRDDFGRYTRRYAFVEKSWAAFEVLLVRERLIGKDVADGLGGDARSKGDAAKAKYNFISGQAGRMLDRELAFVNQEDGSTIQRALPLASTSKSLHGNEGYRFGKLDGVNLKIDLALIPRNQENLLLNLYSYEAQQGDRELPTLGLPTFNINAKVDPPRRKSERLKTPPAQAKLHTDNSTSKNRELVLLELPLSAVCRVTFHNQVKCDVWGPSVRRWATEAGANHAVEVVYAPHSAVSEDELYRRV